MNLAVLRGERSQKDMASILDMEERTYGRLERGENFPSKETLTQICEKLDVTESALFRDKTDPALQTKSSLLGDIVRELVDLDETKLDSLLTIAKKLTAKSDKAKHLNTNNS